jgi:hypothetical protein
MSDLVIIETVQSFKAVCCQSATTNKPNSSRAPYSSPCWWRQWVPPKHRLVFTRLHGASKKTAIFEGNAVSPINVDKDMKILTATGAPFAIHFIREQNTWQKTVCLSGRARFCLTVVAAQMRLQYLPRTEFCNYIYKSNFPAAYIQSFHTRLESVFVFTA